jgi:hypothetical protein
MCVIKRFIFSIFLFAAVQASASSGASWDIDKNGKVDALTDALILIRHLFDVSGDNLFAEAVSLDSPLDNDGLVTSLNETITIADVDGNGKVDALTDALILIRHLFDVSGDNLIDSALSEDATRTTHSQILAYIESKMPTQSNTGEQLTLQGNFNAPDVGNHEWVFSDNGYVAYNQDCFGQYTVTGDLLNASLNCNNYSGGQTSKSLTAVIQSGGNYLQVEENNFDIPLSSVLSSYFEKLYSPEYSYLFTSIAPGIYELNEVDEQIFIEVSAAGEITTVSHPFYAPSGYTPECYIQGSLSSDAIQVVTDYEFTSPSKTAFGSILSISECEGYYGEIVQSVESPAIIVGTLSSSAEYGTVEYELTAYFDGSIIFFDLVCDDQLAPMAQGYSSEFCDGFNDNYVVTFDDATTDGLTGYWGFYEDDDYLILSRDGNARLYSETHECFGHYSFNGPDVSVTLNCVDWDGIQVSKNISLKVIIDGNLIIVTDNDGIAINHNLPKFNQPFIEGEYSQSLEFIKPGIYSTGQNDFFLHINDLGVMTSLSHSDSSYDSNCELSGSIKIINDSDKVFDGTLSLDNCSHYGNPYIDLNNAEIILAFYRQHSSYGTNNFDNLEIYDDSNHYLSLIMLCDDQFNESDYVTNQGETYANNFCGGFIADYDSYRGRWIEESYDSSIFSVLEVSSDDSVRLIKYDVQNNSTLDCSGMFILFEFGEFYSTLSCNNDVVVTVESTSDGELAVSHPDDGIANYIKSHDRTLNGTITSDISGIWIAAEDEAIEYSRLVISQQGDVSFYYAESIDVYKSCLGAAQYDENSSIINLDLYCSDSSDINLSADFGNDQISIDFSVFGLSANIQFEKQTLINDESIEGRYSVYGMSNGYVDISSNGVITPVMVDSLDVYSMAGFFEHNPGGGDVFSMAAQIIGECQTSSCPIPDEYLNTVLDGIAYAYTDSSGNYDITSIGVNLTQQAALSDLNENDEKPYSHAFYLLRKVCEVQGEEYVLTNFGESLINPSLCDNLITSNSFMHPVGDGVWKAFNTNTSGGTAVTSAAFDNTSMESSFNLWTFSQDGNSYIDCIGPYEAEGPDITASLNCSVTGSQFSYADTISLNVFGTYELDEDNPVLTLNIPELNVLIPYGINSYPATIQPGVYDAFGLQNVFITVMDDGHFLTAISEESDCIIEGDFGTMLVGFTHGTMSVNNCEFYNAFSTINPNDTDQSFIAIFNEDNNAIEVTASGLTSGINTFWTELTRVCDEFGQPTTYGVENYGESICGGF